MSKSRVLTGINIQFPISRLILEGKKTVETRTYPIPDHLVGKELAIIETPGKQGNFQARVIGVVVFGRCFQYRDAKAFYQDQPRHCVAPDSPWKWTDKHAKWGWEIIKTRTLKRMIPAPSRKGILYTKNVLINS